MNKKRYGIYFEVRGPLAMFARPDSGSESCSYPIPTPTACIGMIHSICFIPNTITTIQAIGVCHRPEFTSMSFNSTTTVRKTNLIKDGNTCQIKNTVLVNPCFQILATVENSQNSCFNNAHSMQEQFFRRLKRGISFRPVSLGPNDFVANYVGTQVTPVLNDYNEIIHAYVKNYLLQNNTITNVDSCSTLVKHGILQLGDETVVNDKGILKFQNINLLLRKKELMNA